MGPRLNISNIWVAKSVRRWVSENNLILSKLLILLLRSHPQIVNSLLNWTVSQMKNWNRWVKVCTFDLKVLTSDYVVQNLTNCKNYDQFLCTIIRLVERDTGAQCCQWWKTEFKSIFVCIKPWHKRRLVRYSHYVLSQSWWVCKCVRSYVVDLVLLMALYSILWPSASWGSSFAHWM